ncbi:MIP/aquaporin family protein [Allorhodopirellula solitaria]|uniref:Glycerol uptake facilitator protein n=1 Tax=Allorhodopirellula solitaria TaxID=2527987 RepID=A0A5C5YCF8_9BACT|nr:MIP/aquaporin family protein [Allorhodopirellula solitaria]TWT73407.1 Glycerol uptake facilitator protein [Allorhodopirellula solitaria]
MHPMLSEFIGTALLVLFGNGVVANVCLKKTKGNDSGWIVVAAGWGIAVYIGAFCSDAFSGAHLNPAVSIAMLVGGKLSLVDTAVYIVGQMGGAMFGAVLVYLFYREHFRATDDVDAKLACFCTAPAIRDNKQAFFCEALGTFALILPIFLMVTPSFISGDAPVDPAPVLGLGSIGLLPVGLLVFGIGLSLGGTTGYAINPARDLGPRIIHALIPMSGKRDSDWGYSWVPVIGPIVGAVVAAFLYRLIA